MRSTFRKKRNIKIFLLSFIFLLILGSSFCLNSISNIIQGTQSFSFFLIIKFIINGLLALLPLAFLSMGILFILGVLRIFQSFELANFIEDGDGYYINKLLIYFIILASVLMTIFNYFSYFNFNYYKLFDLI